MIIRILLTVALIKTLSVTHKPKWCAAIFGVYVLGSWTLTGMGIQQRPFVEVVLLASIEGLIALGVFWIVDRMENTSAYWPAVMATVILLGNLSPTGLLMMAKSKSRYTAVVPPHIEVLLPGSYRQFLILPQAGGSWMAIYSNTSANELSAQKKTVRLDPVLDPILDNPGQMTGRRVFIVDGRTPLFLVRGIDALSEGPIHRGATSIDGITNSQMDPQRPMIISLDEESYELTINSDNNVEIWDQTHKQILGDAGIEEFPPTVVAVADIDKDGKLDLLLTSHSRFKELNHLLFLSSQSKPPDFFGRGILATAFEEIKKI